MNKNWYAQRAYGVIKLQYYKTVVYITYTTTTMKLKCTICHYILMSLSLQSWVSAKNKRKYKLHQLFKMLSLSLDTCLGSFSQLVWALSTMVIWKSAQTLTTCGFSSGRVLAPRMVLLLPRKPQCEHSTHIKLFKRSQLSADAFSEKNYSQRAYFNEVIPTCFRGLVF